MPEAKACSFPTDVLDAADAHLLENVSANLARSVAEEERIFRRRLKAVSLVSFLALFSFCAIVWIYLPILAASTALVLLPLLAVSLLYAWQPPDRLHAHLQERGYEWLNETRFMLLKQEIGANAARRLPPAHVLLGDNRGAVETVAAIAQGYKSHERPIAIEDDALLKSQTASALVFMGFSATIALFIGLSFLIGPILLLLGAVVGAPFAKSLYARWRWFRVQLMMHRRGYDWISYTDAFRLDRHLGNNVRRIPRRDEVLVLPGYYEGDVYSLIEMMRV